MYAITWIIASTHYKKYFDTALKYFPILIAYTFFNELLGWAIKHYNDYQIVFIQKFSYYNILIYHIYYYIFFIYFLSVYISVFKNEQLKKWGRIGILLFIITSIANAIYLNPLLKPQIFSFVCGSILLISSTVIHLIQLIRESDSRKPKFNLLFWTSLGLLIYHVFYLPLKILRHYDIYTYLKFQNLHIALIFLMYILFCIGFILGKRAAFR